MTGQSGDPMMYDATVLDPGLVDPGRASGTPSAAMLKTSAEMLQSQPFEASQALRQNRNTILPQLAVDPAAGAKLEVEDKDRYEAVQKLGAGGAGEVVLVQDNDIRRLVAMKRMHADQGSALNLMRFVEEVQTTGRLEHPNIVPIHDVGIDQDGQYYYTMKFMDGETLEDIIKKLRKGDSEYHKKFSMERRTQIFIEILYAICYAHERGIIHRDIKPANIMVGPCGEVMVMDWGIAKQIREVKGVPVAELEQLLPARDAELPADLEGTNRHFETQVGTVIGTPAYMSPEQARGENNELDERSDIYSLCAMFYEFLTLRHYLLGVKTLEELFQGVLYREPIDAEKIKGQHQGRVPRESAFFLRRGMAKDKEARFGTVREMIEELERNQEGKICVYCTSTMLKRGVHEYGHFLDNHRVVAVVVFILAGLFALFGAGYAGYQAWQWLMT